jgi:hypothetical protein
MKFYKGMAIALITAGLLFGALFARSAIVKSATISSGWGMGLFLMPAGIFVAGFVLLVVCSEKETI